jgi:hypothetical protein
VYERGLAQHTSARCVQYGNLIVAGIWLLRVLDKDETACCLMPRCSYGSYVRLCLISTVCQELDYFEGRLLG